MDVYRIRTAKYGIWKLAERPYIVLCQQILPNNPTGLANADLSCGPCDKGMFEASDVWDEEAL
jgi:hypothetical protein